MKLYNPFKSHIVKFRDGRYGLRKYSLLVLEFQYKDLRSDRNDLWWCIDSTWIDDCKSVSLEEVIRIKHEESATGSEDIGERV